MYRSHLKAVVSQSDLLIDTPSRDGHELHARIQEFSSRGGGGGGGGGGPGQSDKKKSSDVFFLSPQLILKKSNGKFQRNLSFFSRFQRGSNIFEGGSDFFQGWGGVQLLIPYRNPYNL